MYIAMWSLLLSNCEGKVIIMKINNIIIIIGDVMWVKSN